MIPDQPSGLDDVMQNGQQDPMIFRGILKFPLKLDVLMALTIVLFRRVEDNSSGAKVDIYPISVL